MNNNMKDIVSKLSGFSAEELMGLMRPIDEQKVRELTVDLLQEEKEVLEIKKDYDQMIEEQKTVQDDKTRIRKEI